MRSTEPTDITRPYEMRTVFTLEPLVNMPGRGALSVPVGLATGSIAAIAVSQPDPLE